MYEFRTSDFLIHEIRVFNFQKYEFRTFESLIILDIRNNLKKDYFFIKKY
mgnify:CR=1 FL=1